MWAVSFLLPIYDTENVRVQAKMNANETKW